MCLAGGAQAQVPYAHLQRPTDSSANGPTSWFVTTYEQAGASNIGWTTCGYDATSEGCYGSGQLGPFVRPCAVAGSGGRVFVLDSLGPGSSSVLYVYQQVESSTPSVTLLKTLPLSPLGLTSTGSCSLAVLGAWVYAGHSQSLAYARVHLTDNSVQGGSICGGPTTAITASDKAVVVSMSNCFQVFDKQGNSFGDGGQFSNTFVPGSNGHQLP